MKWSVVAFDPNEDRWFIETVSAEKQFVQAGVLTFLNQMKLLTTPPAETITAEGMIPARKITRYKVPKTERKQVAVRTFAPGKWNDVKLETTL